MANDLGRPRSQPKRSRFAGQPNELGGLLAHLRVAKRLSLREVEEATDKALSNAYLSQLEKGKIQRPSPHVLHSLVRVTRPQLPGIRRGQVRRQPASATQEMQTLTSAKGSLRADEIRCQAGREAAAQRRRVRLPQ